MNPLRQLFVGLAVLAAATPALAKNPPHPSGLKQPVKDGCVRSDFPIGLNQAPEWVYVYRNAAIRQATGVVRVTHEAVDDAILQHESYDFNANLVPDRASRYLMAGSPSSDTNNFAGDRAGNDKEEFRRLHFEWESGTLPLFAWPADGDRAAVWGSWIWDCGHWTNVENNSGEAKLTGEHTELHPINAIAVTRKAPHAAKGNESQTDVFISNDGTIARAVEKCAGSHTKDYAHYDSGFGACTQKKANKIQPLSKSYKFFVPAPAKPKGAGKLRYRTVKHGSSSGSQKVHVGARGLNVTVTMKKSNHVVRYAKSFFVSWAKDASKPATLKVTIKSILIKQADPNPEQPDPTPPSWALTMRVNGAWRLLNDLTPGLKSVTDNKVIEVNRSFKVTVPKGRSVTVQVDGKECDEPAGTITLGLFARILKPCGPNTDEQNPDPLRLLMNDATGIILDSYKSAQAAIGDHLATAAQTRTFPGTGAVTFGHGLEADATYQVRYVIARG